MTEPDSKAGPEEPEQTPGGGIEMPPHTVLGILGRLGPGLIIAASIVGSGELIATTKTGAQAGFWLLWLIIIGCVIKVFVQVEFGRYAISSGKPTMTAMDEVPGPRVVVNWLVWYWLVMFICSLAQLGGIAGGVGQSMATSFPITGDFQDLLERQNQWDARAIEMVGEMNDEEASQLRSRDREVRRPVQEKWRQLLTQRLGPRPDLQDTPTWDDIYWASLMTAATVVMLVIGRYVLVQNVSTLLVAAFTGVTVFCVFAVQQTEYAFTWGEIGRGFQGRLPSWDVVTRSRLALVKGDPVAPLATALAAFGIIGVGATELIAYPYWCLEKGYARFTGARDQTAQWAERARGWMRVMRWDAGLSMVIYTFATLAFYILGASVLHRQGLDPERNQMIYALSQPYVQVFGTWAHWLFLFGAFAVLYSTFFVAIAGHARVSADAAAVYGLAKRTQRSQLWWVRGFCVLLPLVSLGFCIFIRHPVKMVLASGVMQAVMLPMLAGATLYFRYRRCDRRITPGKLWDTLFWISAVGLLVAGFASGWFGLQKLVGQFGLW
jgi:Mn2+/Fe2+ NRAMP family transporter